MCHYGSILRFAKAYVKILHDIRYFYILPKRYVKILTHRKLLTAAPNKQNSVVFHVSTYNIMDRHVRINGSLWLLTLRYVT